MRKTDNLKIKTMPRSSQAELTSIIEAFPFTPHQRQGWAGQGAQWSEEERRGVEHPSGQSSRRGTGSRGAGTPGKVTVSGARRPFWGPLEGRQPEF